MDFELFRNNYLFDENISYPIKFEEESKLAKGSHLGSVSIFETFLYASTQEYLYCIELKSKKAVWTKKEGFIGAPKTGDNKRIYVTLNNGFACMDSKTGQYLYKQEDAEYIGCASDDNLYCVNVEKNIVLCRSKETGGEIWRTKPTAGFVGCLIVENDVLIIWEEKGLLSYKSLSGELLWAFRFDEWIENHFKDKWHKLLTLGPLVDGIQFIGFLIEDGGIVAAVNAETGDLIWTHDVGELAPNTMIVHGHILYYIANQGWGTKNYLTGVETDTGKRVFRTDENITPVGCYHPAIVGNHFIGGRGRYLAFFDLVQQKFVWRYKHKQKKDIFQRPFLVYEDQLIFPNYAENVLYWFRSRQAKEKKELIIKK